MRRPGWTGCRGSQTNRSRGRSNAAAIPLCLGLPLPSLRLRPAGSGSAREASTASTLRCARSGTGDDDRATPGAASRRTGSTLAARAPGSNRHLRRKSVLPRYVSCAFRCRRRSAHLQARGEQRPAPGKSSSPSRSGSGCSASAVRRAQAVEPAGLRRSCRPGGPDRSIRFGTPGQARLVVHGSRVSGRGASSRRGPAGAQFEGPHLLSLPDRHDVAGPFRSAVPADGA